MKTYSRGIFPQSSTLFPEEESKKQKSLLSFVQMKEQPGLCLGEEPEKKEVKKEAATKKSEQLFLNFGQSMYTKCHTCGVLYAETVQEEVKLHRKLHQKYVSYKKKTDQSEEAE